MKVMLIPAGETVKFCTFSGLNKNVKDKIVQAIITKDKAKTDFFIKDVFDSHVFDGLNLKQMKPQQIKDKLANFSYENEWFFKHLPEIQTWYVFNPYITNNKNLKLDYDDRYLYISSKNGENTFI